LWASKPPVVHVLGETWTLLHRRCGHRAAIAPLPSDTAPVRVEHIPQSWRNSFVDATSFALLCDKNDHNAYAFDGSFSAAGFVELRP
jgi:uncharacterized protein